jgi:hypothetical protein
MNESDFFSATELHADEFKAANTLEEFISLIPDNRASWQIGMMKSAIEKYGSEYWGHRYFATIKNHGFMTRALELPNVRKAAELFESVALYPMSTGGRASSYAETGAVFISTSGRDNGFAYFGPLGARYDWSPDWLKRGEKVRRQSGGQNWLTGGVPSPALKNCWGACEDPEWRLSTVEVIKWEDGRFLAVGRARNGFSSRWLAVLDAGESVMPMLSEWERGEIAAEKAAQAAAWVSSDSEQG